MKEKIMPRKKQETTVQKVVDQRMVANTIVQFLEVFKNSSVENLMGQDLSRKDLETVSRVLNSNFETTKSKAFDYVSKL